MNFDSDIDYSPYKDLFSSESVFRKYQKLILFISIAFFLVVIIIIVASYVRALNSKKSDTKSKPKRDINKIC